MRDGPLAKIDYEALSDFRYQLRRFVRWSEQLTRRLGVTNLQYLLMLHIKGAAGREWATITELAERLQAQHHGVVSLVSRSQKLGIVVRKPGRKDGREVEVHLTAKGERLVQRLAALHKEELLRLEGKLAAPTAEQLAGGTAPQRASAMDKGGCGPGDGAPIRRGELDTQVLRHLAAARYSLPEKILPAEAAAAWSKVEHYLHKNKLHLALDIAMSVGKELSAGKDYWREILLATRLMELDEQAGKLAQWIAVRQED
jgi:DNA-binding MarR family transcriptional regulator